MSKVLFAFIAALLCAAAPADNFLYLGAGISKDRLSEITDSGAVFSDIHNTSWKVLAGFRPISVVSAEVDYLDLGSQSGTFLSHNGNGNANAKAFAAYGVGYLPNPVPFLDLFGKVGLARWQLDGNGTASVPQGTALSIFSFSKRGTEFAWGVGAGVHISNIGARLEYESFNIPNTNGARIISLEAVLGLF